MLRDKWHHKKSLGQFQDCHISCSLLPHSTGNDTWKLLVSLLYLRFNLTDPFVIIILSFLHSNVSYLKSQNLCKWSLDSQHSQRTYSRIRDTEWILYPIGNASKEECSHIKIVFKKERKKLSFFLFCCHQIYSGYFYSLTPQSFSK